MSLQKHTIVNVLWSLGELFLRKSSAVAITLVLAWLLSPSDFGLVAMMAIFLAVAQALVTGGLRSALVRQVEVSNLDLNTVFYTNLLLSFGTYLILFFLAPVISEFYEESRLTDLIRVASLTIIFQAFSIVPLTLIQRNMLFKLQVKTTLPASILSGLIAIVAAYFGFGVWAIVIQMVSFPVLNSLLLWRLQLWQFKWEFSWIALKPLIGFSGYILIDNISTQIFAKMYVAVIAKFFSATVSGWYFFADKIRELLIMQLVSAVQQVTFPALSKIQEDGERLKEGYRKIILVSIVIIFPVFALIGALAFPLFDTILPQKWLPAAEYLQWMCLIGLTVPLHQIANNIFMVKNRADLVFYLGIFEKGAMVVLLALTFHDGVVAILIGQLIAWIIAYFPKMYLASRLLGYQISEQLWDLLPTLFITLSVAVGVYVASQYLVWPSYAELLVLGALGTLVYVLTLYVFRLRGFKLVLALVQSKLH